MKEYYEEFLKLETKNKVMLLAMLSIILLCFITGNMIAVAGWGLLLYTQAKLLKG